MHFAVEYGICHTASGELPRLASVNPLRINILRLRQNCHHFKDKIFLNENVQISLEIWLNFVLEFRIENISAIFQIMAWRRPSDKPLYETMMV